ncbi:hypothetical protein GF371_02625 [Candidatus Woesearchaeota archaeon]|nr:hypothetical protein [Candidatus Woesearchaeota archaeon]
MANNSYPTWSLNYNHPQVAIDVVEHGIAKVNEADNRLAIIAEAEGIDKDPQAYWDNHDVVREHLSRILNDRTKINRIERDSVKKIARQVGNIVIKAQREEALEALVKSIPIIGEDVSFRKLITTPNSALIYFPFRYLKGVVSGLGLMRKNMRITEEPYSLKDIEAEIARYKDYLQNPGHEESEEHKAFWRRRLPGSYGSGKRR